MQYTSNTTHSFYLQNGELSTTGHQAYWSCVGRIIKDFDTEVNQSKLGSQNTTGTASFRRHNTFHQNKRRRLNNNFHYKIQFHVAQTGHSLAIWFLFAKFCTSIQL